MSLGVRHAVTLCVCVRHISPVGEVNALCPVLFKPPPPVGAGGGYMFSGRPSVTLSVRPCVRP